MPPILQWGTVDVKPGVGYFVREASRAYSRVLQTGFVELGVTPPQFFYLRALWENDGMTQTELGTRLGSDRGTISFVLTTMEKQGLIERRVDAQDLRRTRVFLTSRGKRLRGPLLSIANRMNDVATAGLSATAVTQVKNSLEKIIMNLEQFGE